MTPDDYLEKLLDAVEQDNYKDIINIAGSLLNNIHNIKDKFQDDLKPYLQDLINNANVQIEREKYKEDLINQILNQKK